MHGMGYQQEKARHPRAPGALCVDGAVGTGMPHRHHPLPDLQVLLLEDLLVLLQKQDEKLLLKCHSKTAGGSSDSKQTFSPVLKLNAVLVRSVATGTVRRPSPLAWAPGP